MKGIYRIQFEGEFFEVKGDHYTIFSLLILNISVLAIEKTMHIKTLYDSNIIDIYCPFGF